LEDVVAVGAKMWKDDRGVGEFLRQVTHLTRVGMDLQDEIQLRRQLHHFRPLGRVVFVSGHIVAELAQPDETELLVAMFDLAQRFVYPERRDHTTSAKPPFITIYILRHFAVSIAIIIGGLRLVAPRRRDHASPNATFIEISHELWHIPSDQVPL